MTDTDFTQSDQYDVALRGMNLAQSVNDAFTNVDATRLRQWYVRTFVMDEANWAVLASIGAPTMLSYFSQTAKWPTTEHAAIGHRLLWTIDPASIAPVPDLLNPDGWRNESDVMATLFHVFEPWRQMRYDPEGENWYTLVAPGQWQRHGKGKPSQNAVEGRILTDSLRLADNTTTLCAQWPLDTSRFGGDSNMLTAALLNSIKALKKYMKSDSGYTKVRSAMERHPIMYLDTTTLNQVRQIAPFANGALCLVTDTFKDTAGVSRTNRVGDLLPFDADYMVTNANSLPWLDAHNVIPDSYAIWQTTGDSYDLDQYEDELLSEHAPTYWSFLTHAFPDVDERMAFMRLLGAAMYGSNLKVVAAMIGEPNAGKDTVLNWLTYLMPGQVATLPSSAFTAQGDDDRGFAPLLGKRVATVSGEVGEGRGSKLLADKIKTVSSGGGTLRVAEKYEKPTTIFFDGMLWIQANSVPTIQGTDVGLANRLVAVEFRYPFPLVARSYEADYRREAPYFAQIVFIHYLRYMEGGGGMGGIKPPESWRTFAREFTDAANPHGFLEACIVKSQTTVPTQQFHAALSAMVSKFGSPYPVGANYWSKRLRALGFPLKGPNSIRKQVMIHGERSLCYYLSIDATQSEGAFTQQQWEATLKDAAVV